MKAQRRHELQTNVLSVELTRVADFAKKNANFLAWGALGVAVVILGITWYAGHVRTQAEAVQAQYIRLLSTPTGEQRLEELKALAQKDKYPMWAALAADEAGAEVQNQLMIEWPGLTDARRKELAVQAKGFYQQVLDKYPNQDLAVAKAHYGLGKLAESFGNLDEAKSEYLAVDQMASMEGQPVKKAAEMALNTMGEFQGELHFAATMPNTAPASGPAGAATQPVRGELVPAPPASAPAEAPKAVEPSKAAEPASAPASRP